MSANLMRAVAYVQALADATTIEELDAARLAAIKSGQLAYFISPGEPTSDGSMVLSECDRSWDGRVLTLAAWVARVSDRKRAELEQAAPTTGGES